jgi:hypothetical protein
MGATLLVLFLSCAFALGAESAGCPKRVVRFRIGQSEIAEIELRQGHQPWRSNSETVAEAAVLQVEPDVAPNTADSIPFKSTVVSPSRQIFRFELIDLHHIDEITVQRLRWRNPRTGKTELTGAWWATKAVISDCETAGGK